MTVPSDGSIIVFDTETTGLIANSAIPLKSQPHIIELFAVKMDVQDVRAWDADHEKIPVETWGSLFHHGPLSEETTKITGINSEMVASAPPFAERVKSLAEFTRGACILVGHNLSYDRDMLAIELRRLGMSEQFPWPARHICTVEESETLTGFRLGLNDLHERLTGLRFDSHHRAEPDTRATARVFLELVKAGSIRL